MTTASTVVLARPQQEAAEDPPGPLSPQQQQQLTEAFGRVRKVDAATKVATFNGWCTGTFSIISLLFGVFSVTAFVVGVGLAFVAWNEFRGRNMLRALDGRATLVLGWNQLGFLGLLVGYSLWSIYASLTGPDPYAAYIKSNPELRLTLEPIGELYTATLAVYGGVILFSLVVQGLNAAYYFSRGRYLQAYLDQTPQWVVALQRRWPR